MAPSRLDWKIVDWDVKPQHNQPTNQPEPKEKEKSQYLNSSNLPVQTNEANLDYPKILKSKFADSYFNTTNMSETFHDPTIIII